MPELAGEPNELLVMVLMVMGVPPFPMVGRQDGQEHAAVSLRVPARSGTSLLGPPLGLVYSLIEILGEGGKERIGQNDHFAMV